MKLPLIILGAGGHAKVLLEILAGQGENILGFTDAAWAEGPEETGNNFMGFPVLGRDDSVTSYPCEQVRLVNGLGSIQAVNKRQAIYLTFEALGYQFTEVIHRTAIVSAWSTLGAGVQLMAGSIVQPGTTIGENTLINTKAAVDHDCRIGAHVHLGPGVTLSGGVEVGDGVHVGTGATVIQGIRIGEAAFVAAGSLVVHDVPAGTRVMGVPARIF